MKKITKAWLVAAEDDLLAAKQLIKQPRLSNLCIFHCQQCLEKSFKAMMEEKDIPFIKSHDLLKLRKLISLELNHYDENILKVISEAYLDARYPGDLGLLPNGKPTVKETEEFISISEKISMKIRDLLSANQ